MLRISSVTRRTKLLMARSSLSMLCVTSRSSRCLYVRTEILEGGCRAHPNKDRYHLVPSVCIPLRLMKTNNQYGMLWIVSSSIWVIQKLYISRTALYNAQYPCGGKYYEEGLLSCVLGVRRGLRFSIFRYCVQSYIG